MRSLPLSQYPTPSEAPPYFADHSVFTEQIEHLKLPAHSANHTMICSLSGTFRVKLNGRKLVITTADFLLINRGSTLELDAPGTTEPLIICFQTGIDTRPELSLDWKMAERLYTASDSFKKLVTSLADLGDSCSSFISLQADSILRSLLSQIVSHSKIAEEESQHLDVKKMSTREENYKRLASVRDWIEENFARPITLRDLATAAALDQQHFLRLFAQLYGKTPRQYLIDRRIEEAKKLLLESSYSAKEICHAIGWESPGTFSLLFKQKTGSTPGTFRQAMTNTLSTDTRR